MLPSACSVAFLCHGTYIRSSLFDDSHFVVSLSRISSLTIASLFPFRFVSVARGSVEQHSKNLCSTDVVHKNTGIPRACRAALLCMGT